VSATATAADPAVAPGPVDWQLATRSARWLLDRNARPPAYGRAELVAMFEELTAEAEDLVATHTGWRSPRGRARARVADRAEWVDANIASIRRLLGPTLARVEARRAEQPGLPPALAWTARPFATAGRSASGVQLGLVLAWLSSRVLGQYDLLVTNESADVQDLVYYVGPNVVAIETAHRFAPRQFRLWLALHEVTHRCQFTAVPWLRDYFVTLVDQGLEPLASDPHHFSAALRRVAEDLRAGRSPLGEAGMLGLVASPDQLEAIHRLQALMSVLEGHGDVTMDRAGEEAIPDVAHFRRVLHERRTRSGPQQLLNKLLGLDAKFRQYEQGEHFVRAVEEIAGVEAFEKVWRGPEWLPSLEELREPQRWVHRVEPGSS
jgi:coenzyme F420 biosynthesis associated uncharacterized protein